MTFSGFSNKNLFEMNAALQHKVRALEHTVEEYKSGRRYLKLQEDHHRVVAGYIREIKQLKKELADAHAQSIEVRKIWADTCDHVWEEYRTETAKKDEKIRKLPPRLMNDLWLLECMHHELMNEYNAYSGLEEWLNGWINLPAKSELFLILLL